jgi:asparagine synthetase B (glutamine-hydrolysing)
MLFSGGVDSAVLAALADRCLPPHEPIDLINVAFEYQDASADAAGLCFASPDRRLGLRALRQLWYAVCERSGQKLCV